MLGWRRGAASWEFLSNNIVIRIYYALMPGCIGLVVSCCGPQKQHRAKQIFRGRPLLLGTPERKKKEKKKRTSAAAVATEEKEEAEG